MLFVAISLANCSFQKFQYTFASKIQFRIRRRLAGANDPRPRFDALCIRIKASHLGSLRFFSSSGRQLKNRVPEYQKLFQEDNGLPVHLKGGVTDVLLYRFTIGLSAFGTPFEFCDSALSDTKEGTALAVFELFRASQPKQNK
ncbi:UNVERIFIED_CONTAM: hypothetical protein K2H54_036353 [Gekko kuhli]